jgi:lysine 6-dehydrogenase
MKVVIFGGGGRMGRGAAWDLCRDPEVEAVGLADLDEGGLEAARQWLGSDKVQLHSVDAADQKAVKAMLAAYDVGISTLPNRHAGYKLVEAAIEAGVDLVEIAAEYHRRPDEYETEGLELPAGLSALEYGEQLHERASERGVTVLDGMGFAPGLSNITLGEGIRKLDQASSAVARVGGIPTKQSAARHPLGYFTTWSLEHVLREYVVPTKVIEVGKAVEVAALSGHEEFVFDELGVREELECAVTPGMPSFLYTQRDLEHFTEKTIRWPGHYTAVDTLIECGLLDLEPLDYRGVAVAPRQFLLALLGPRLTPTEDDSDLCVMFNTVKGVKDGRGARLDYYMWEEADRASGLSAMARVTGFPAAIGAKLLAQGEIEAKGIVAPEECILGPIYERFMEQLEAREIIIKEVFSGAVGDDS